MLLSKCACIYIYGNACCYENVCTCVHVCVRVCVGRGWSRFHSDDDGDPVR